MNVKLKVLTAGVLFFTGQALVAQEAKKDSASTKEKKIEEVVLTGYQRKTKKEITTSVAQINAKALNNTSISTFDQIIAGKVAGVDLAIGSGQPGSANTSVIIRGVGSINGNSDPLYIVDGTPVTAGTFSAINANDFESISVLRDAAAKSMYGSQAGAGVIIATTKSGRKGTTRVQYTGSIGVSLKPQAKFNMMNTQQITQIQKELGYINETVYNQRNTIDTHWDNIFLRTGSVLSNDINVSGGANNTTYAVSLGHLDQKGIVVNTGLQRVTGSINLRSGNGKNFRFGFNGIFGFSKRDGVSAEGATNLNNPIAGAYLGMPYTKLYNNDGSLATGRGLYAANAYERLITGQRRLETSKATTSLFAEYDITPKLTAKVSGAVDYTDFIYKNYTSPTSFFGKSITPGNAGDIERGNRKFIGLNSNASLTYKDSFGQHNIKAFILAEYTGKFHDYFGVTGYNIDPLIGNNLSAITVSSDILPGVSGISRKATILSYLANIDYNYQEKYFLSANFRRDGGSVFSKNYKWGNFGGISAGWAISQENFLKDTFINDLKLRASWGILGNSVDLFGTRLYNQDSYLSSSTYNGQQSLEPLGPYNNEYRWEKENQLNIGIDFGLWDNRISGTIDIYNKNTTDLYIDKSISRTTGFNQFSNFNGGKMNNKGIEVTLNFDIIKNSNTRLSFNTNFAYNKNKIVSLGDVTEYKNGTAIIRTGLPLGSHYVVKWGGVDPSNGMPIYIDRAGNPIPHIVNKDGSLSPNYIGSEAQATFGSYIPPYTGGFGLDFKHKGFYVSGQFQWKAKYYRLNNMRYFLENAANINNYNQYQIVGTYWKTPGQITDIQSPEYKLEFSSKHIEDSSFLRLRTIRIGYEFKKDLLRGTGLSGADIFFNATNLFTWTKWTGLDPDDNNNVSQFEYPSPRTITMGVSLTF